MGRASGNARLRAWAKHCLAAAVLGAGVGAAAEPATKEPVPAAKAEVAKSELQQRVDDAVALYRKGDVEGALKGLREARAKHPELSPAEVVLARVCFASQKPGDGAKWLELAAVKASDDPEPFNWLAELAVRRGQLAEAELMFGKAWGLAKGMPETAARKQPQTVIAIAGLAAVQEQRGEWKHAEKLLREWIAIESKNVAAWNRLGTALFKQGQEQAARTTFERMAKFAADQPPTAIKMGLHFEAAGKREQAKVEFLAAVKGAPGDLATRIAVANWALNAQEFELAKANASEAKKLEPESLVAKLILGMVARFEGKTPIAEKLFREAQMQSPINFDANQQLVLVLLEQDVPEKDRQALEQAVVLARSHSDLRQRIGREAAATLAWAQFRSGQIESAEQTIVAVMQAGDFSPDAAWFAANIMRQRGQIELATQLLRGAIGTKRTFVDRLRAEEMLAEIGKQEVRNSQSETRKKF